ncbi:MAG: hypothetical protein V7646_4812 [Pseudonocardia sp.]|jgi:hypothetical protein
MWPRSSRWVAEASDVLLLRKLRTRPPAHRATAPPLLTAPPTTQTPSVSAQTAPLVPKGEADRPRAEGAGDRRAVTRPPSISVPAARGDAQQPAARRRGQLRGKRPGQREQREAHRVCPPAEPAAQLRHVAENQVSLVSGLTGCTGLPDRRCSCAACPDSCKAWPRRATGRRPRSTSGVSGRSSFVQHA